MLEDLAVGLLMGLEHLVDQGGQGHLWGYALHATPQ
jgi:hypothetical protein